MTLDAFLDALAQTPRRWRVGSERAGDLALRCDGRCPITAVAADLEPADPPWRLTEWPAAAAQLGLDYDLARAIVCAADDGDQTYPPETRLRDRLLAACGSPLHG